MSTAQELSGVPVSRKSTITVGVFDGVHLGHRHIIARLIEESLKTGTLAGIVTFRNHPASVLDSSFEPSYLTNFEDRMDKLKVSGIDFVVPMSFDINLSNFSPSQFTDLLQLHLNMSSLVIGPDFAMGHNRSGSPEILKHIGEEKGFLVKVVEPLTDNEGIPVKSTRIRNALNTGNVEMASALLGYNFVLEGKVVKGQGRGRSIGFPTANLETNRDMAIPGNGIYATRISVGNEKHLSATSIGTNPTFHENIHSIEVFILDFDDNIYDQSIKLEFVKPLRNEIKFESVEKLRTQIGKDIKHARSILTS